MYRELGLDDLPNEIWRDVLNFEDVYQVSNLGRIKTKARTLVYDRGLGRGVASSVKKEKIKKQTINKRHGYLTCGLSSVGTTRTRTIHSIVAEAFLGLKRGGEFVSESNTVNHKNLNKLDNTIENLEIITRAENVRHAVDFGVGRSIKVTYKGVEYKSKAEMRRKLNIKKREQERLLSF